MQDHKSLRRLSGGAVLVVAAIAATVSYLHIYRLALLLGQPQLAALLMPLSVDGAVAAASAALLWSARSGQPSSWSARVMLASGVLATLAANADYGSAHGPAGILMSMWPGLAFIGSAETALSIVRRSAQRAPVAEKAAAKPVLALQPERTRSAPRKRTRSAPVTNADAPLKYASEIAEGRAPSMRRVKSEMRVGQAKATELVAHLGALAEGTAA